MVLEVVGKQGNLQWSGDLCLRMVVVGMTNANWPALRGHCIELIRPDELGASRLEAQLLSQRQVPTSHQSLVFRHRHFGVGKIPSCKCSANPSLAQLLTRLDVHLGHWPSACNVGKNTGRANHVVIASRREMRQKLLAAG